MGHFRGHPLSSVKPLPAGSPARHRLAGERRLRLILDEQRRYEEEHALYEIANGEVDAVQLQIDDRRTEQDRQSRETREEQSLRLTLHHPEESDRGHGAADEHREAQERQWHFNIPR